MALLTIRDATQYYRVSAYKLQKLFKSGKLTKLFPNQLRNQIYISSDELEKYFKKKYRQQTKDTINQRLKKKERGFAQWLIRTLEESSVVKPYNGRFLLFWEEGSFTVYIFDAHALRVIDVFTVGSFDDRPTKGEVEVEISRWVEVQTCVAEQTREDRRCSKAEGDGSSGGETPRDDR